MFLSVLPAAHYFYDSFSSLGTSDRSSKWFLMIKMMKMLVSVKLEWLATWLALQNSIFFNFTDPGEITFIESHMFETGETLGEVLSEFIGDRLWVRLF